MRLNCVSLNIVSLPTALICTRQERARGHCVAGEVCLRWASENQGQLSPAHLPGTGHPPYHELHVTLVHACFLQPVCSPRTSDPGLQEDIDVQLGQTQCGLQMPRSPGWALVAIFVSERPLADCLHLIHPWSMETSLDVLTAGSKAERLPLFSQSQASQVTPTEVRG